MKPSKRKLPFMKTQAKFNVSLDKNLTAIEKAQSLAWYVYLIYLISKKEAIVRTKFILGFALSPLGSPKVQHPLCESDYRRRSVDNETFTQLSLWFTAKECNNHCTLKEWAVTMRTNSLVWHGRHPIKISNYLIQTTFSFSFFFSFFPNFRSSRQKTESRKRKKQSTDGRATTWAL
jgi:hypothetical protein